MRNLIFSFLASCILFGGNVYAADAAAVPGAKIGVVDIQVIAADSEPAKAAKLQLENRYGKQRAAIEKQGKDLQKQAESLKNPKTTDKKRMDFVKAKQKLDNDTRDFLRKVEQDEVKLRQDMVTLVFNAAYEVARAKGFNFVVDISGGGVLYADQSMDLTQAVLEEVNKLYAAGQNKVQSTPAAQETPPAAETEKK